MSEENTVGGLENFFAGMVKFCQLIANAFSAYHNWYIKNADTIAQYLLAFANLGRWYAAVNELADHQIVFTGELTSELTTEIIDTDDVDGVIEKYYFSNDAQYINDMIVRCRQYMQSSPYTELFSQVLASYTAAHYHLACIGMFVLVDGVLADFSENKKTGYKIRINAIEEKINDRLELSDLDKRTICICKTICSFEESIFKDCYNFENEPSVLNRHWVMHGRSQRVYTRYDFLKVLLWLDAIAFLSAKIEEKDGI